MHLLRNAVVLPCLALAVAGCASKVSTLGAEGNDHSLTILSTCGGGLSEGLTGKLRAELQNRSASADAEALLSIKMAMSDSEKLKYDEFTKCALEMDKRIRDEKRTENKTARIFPLVDTAWEARELEYEDREIRFSRPSASEISITAKGKGHSSQQQSFSSNMMPWFRFVDGGILRTETNGHDHRLDPKWSLFFSAGSDAGWEPGGKPGTLRVRNGTLFPPSFSAPEEAAYEFELRDTRLTLVRLEGPPNSLKRGVFELR